MSRKTKETSIEVTLDLDGTGRAQIDTPLPFLTHMVEQIARHGLIDLTVRATGDIEIDGHHTTEDLGLVLGQCVAKALGDKAGLVRYGWATLPMDEARVSPCALDLSGRKRTSCGRCRCRAARRSGPGTSSSRRCSSRRSRAAPSATCTS